MEVLVFSSTESICVQKNKDIRSIKIDNRDMERICTRYVLEVDKFYIFEYLNSRFIKIVLNLFCVLDVISSIKNDYVLSLQHKIWQKNNKLANFFIMPVFYNNGMLEINPINCNDETIICIYLLKGKIPFLVEVYDGEIEIINNNRNKKNKKIRKKLLKYKCLSK